MYGAPEPCNGGKPPAPAPKKPAPPPPPPKKDVKAAVNLTAKAVTKAKEAKQEVKHEVKKVEHHEVKKDVHRKPCGCIDKKWESKSKSWFQSKAGKTKKFNESEWQTKITTYKEMVDVFAADKTAFDIKTLVQLRKWMESLSGTTITNTDFQLFITDFYTSHNIKPTVVDTKNVTLIQSGGEVTETHTTVTSTTTQSAPASVTTVETTSTVAAPTTIESSASSTETTTLEAAASSGEAAETTVAAEETTVAAASGTVSETVEASSASATEETASATEVVAAASS